MASVRFEKGSVYWRMFAEYYNFCQDYWGLEDTDEWWEEVHGKCNEFIARYGGSLFARGLCAALVSHLEEMKRGGDGKEESLHNSHE